MRKYVNTTTAIISALIIAVVIISAIFYFQKHVDSTSSTPVLIKTATSSVATATSSVRKETVTSNKPIVVSSTHVPTFSIDSRDTPLSWNLSNTPSESIIKKYKQEVSSLTSELHKGKYTDYNIYLQLGQEYQILGEGKQAYGNYLKAAALEPKKGVAMSNIGLLMSQIGALHTAQNAYAKSVIRQPSVSLFWVLYLKFLAQYEPKSPKTPAVFASARKATSNDTNILIVEAQWLASIGHNKSAISDWKTIRISSPSEQQKAIDERIAKLESNI